jgi:hypothetical protein
LIFLASPVIEASPTWRTYLQDCNQIAQIIGTILVIVYVIYTYKTFRQIKKQTDYQQDAYLKVEPVFVNEIKSTEGMSVKVVDGRIVQTVNSLPLKYLNKEIPAKMTEILKPIFKFDDNLFEGNFYTVNLINYGNAEVNLIKLDIFISIANSKDVAEKKMLKEKDNHTYKVSIPEIISRNGGKLKIPIISTASFPIYSITLKGEYFDVRNKKYIINEIITTGVNDHFLKLT